MKVTEQRTVTGGVMMICPKRFGFLWRVHHWLESIFVYPGRYGERRLTRQCKRCGEIEVRDLPGGP